MGRIYYKIDSFYHLNGKCKYKKNVLVGSIFCKTKCPEFIMGNVEFRFIDCKLQKDEDAKPKT